MKEKNSMEQTLTLLGWREWVSLPQLGISALKCKVDTGAKSSALHAFAIEEFYKGDALWIRFGIHPRQKDEQAVIWCEAAVVDQRQVTDSGGHTTERYFIRTEIELGEQRFEIMMSLTNRDTMRFRMLLGREALNGRFLVNPAASYCQGKKQAYSPSAENVCIT